MIEAMARWLRRSEKMFRFFMKCPTYRKIAPTGAMSMLHGNSMGNLYNNKVAAMYIPITNK